MICSRYGGAIDYVMALGFTEGFSLIQKAAEKSIERRLWEQWNIEHAAAALGEVKNYPSWEDFRAQALQPTQESSPHQSAAEIIAWAENIRKTDQAGR